MKKENKFSCLYGHNIISNGLNGPKILQSVNKSDNKLHEVRQGHDWTAITSGK